MTSLLWDGTSLFQKDDQLVVSPGECCCCSQTCPVPSAEDCEEIIWAQCSGTGCFERNFSGCLTNIPAALESQGYHILTGDDYCCNCDGFSLQNVYACCSGFIATDGEDDLLLPANTSGDCEFCYGVAAISLENINDEYFWRIPKCMTESSSSSSSGSSSSGSSSGEEYYCILEE